MRSEDALILKKLKLLQLADTVITAFAFVLLIMFVVFSNIQRYDMISSIDGNKEEIIKNREEIIKTKEEIIKTKEEMLSNRKLGFDILEKLKECR